MAYIVGTNASETITGTEDGDSILGLGGDDHIIGLGDNDRLIGGAGADILDGGDGDDVYDIDPSDTIVDSGGWDGIRATVSTDLADYAGIENLAMATSASGRQLLGSALDNEMTDRDGSNILNGREGDDYLLANGGDDILIGGMGVDYLHGGGDDDRFDFNAVAETGVGMGLGYYTRDQIMDFERGDRIHLGRIDADAGHSGNQAFSFLGATGFTGTAGELVVRQELLNTNEIGTVIAADTNGDGIADFEIELRGTYALTAADFIL
jgi:Ca2+-binding RTX toxin-like protein